MAGSHRHQAVLMSRKRSVEEEWLEHFHTLRDDGLVAWRYAELVRRVHCIKQRLREVHSSDAIVVELAWLEST